MMATETQTRTFTTSKGHEIVTTLTDEECIEALREQTGNFPQDLVRSYDERGTLSRNQWPWAHKLALESTATPTAPEADDESYQMPGIVSLLHRALDSGLKYPKVTVSFEQYGTLRLSVAGDGARYPGAINVTDGGSFDDGTFFGRIHSNGVWAPSRSTAMWVTAALLLMDEQPDEIARVHGVRTGNCCFCGKDLTTDESVAAGYGPVCAGKWGLPWGGG